MDQPLLFDLVHTCFYVAEEFGSKYVQSYLNGDQAISRRARTVSCNCTICSPAHCSSSKIFNSETKKIKHIYFMQFKIIFVKFLKKRWFLNDLVRKYSRFFAIFIFTLDHCAMSKIPSFFFPCLALLWTLAPFHVVPAETRSTQVLFKNSTLLTIMNRRPVGSTDQANPSFFYFRIS